MKDYIYQLSTQGYTLMKNALSLSQIDELRDAFETMLDQDRQSWGMENLLEMGQWGALRNLADEHPAFEQLLAKLPIYPILDEVFTEDYILHSYDGLVLFPGDSRFPWDFHSDLTSLGGVAFPANRTPGINSLCYIDDVTAENGATWIVPASQRTLMTNPDADELARLALQATGKAGDIILFDARIWHCAGNNQTPNERRVIKSLFVASWLRPQMDYSRSIRPDIRERLDARIQKLIGIGTTPPTSVTELRERLAKRSS